MHLISSILLNLVDLMRTFLYIIYVCMFDFLWFISEDLDVDLCVLVFYCSLMHLISSISLHSMNLIRTLYIAFGSCRIYIYIHLCGCR